MTPSVREYRAEDRPELVSMMEELQDHLAGVDVLKIRRRTPEYGPAFVERLLADVEKHGGRILLAEDGGKILGCIAGLIVTQSEEDLYEWVPLKTGRVTDLVVRDAHRGGGVGRMLLEALEQWFREQKCDVCRIEVLSSNAGAVRFYEKHGYGERFRDLIKKL